MRQIRNTGSTTLSLLTAATMLFTLGSCSTEVSANKIQETAVHGKSVFSSVSSAEDNATATLDGTLEFDSAGCLVAQIAGKENPVLVVWPSRATVSSNEVAVEFDRTKYMEGSPVTLGGGYQKVSDLKIDTSCQADEAFLAN